MVGMLSRWLIVILAVAVLVGCVPAPAPGPTPLALVQRIGYGEPRQPNVPRTLRNRGMWHYDWSPICANGNVPMVYSGIDAWTTEEVARCRNMREPVLMIGNEPEWGHQSNWTPEYAADVIDYYAARWDGEIWCCGTLSTHLGYINRIYESYVSRHGEWPVDRLHIHVYANDGFTASMPFDSGWVDDNRRQVERHVKWLKERGLPERVIVSECCLLSNDATPDEYIATMDTYMRMLRGFPAVESVAWFSSYYYAWRGSNLTDRAGRLTPVGEAWLDWRWK